MLRMLTPRACAMQPAMAVGCRPATGLKSAWPSTATTAPRTGEPAASVSGHRGSTRSVTRSTATSRAPAPQSINAGFATLSRSR